MTLTKDQIEQMKIALQDMTTTPHVTNDPYVNYLIDCITDEYTEYDEELYKEEIKTMHPAPNDKN